MFSHQETGSDLLPGLRDAVSRGSARRLPPRGKLLGRVLHRLEASSGDGDGSRKSL